MNYSNTVHEKGRGADHSIDEILSGLNGDDTIGNVSVIGGAQIFEIALRHASCAHFYSTDIDAEFSCDTFFPETPGFRPVLSSPWIEENGIRYRFRRYDRA
jgi:dihydrofolate reductase